MATKTRKSTRRDPGRKIWQQRGPEAAYFQREAQVNFWTVMGGLAVGALLTQIPTLLAQVQAGRWYLILYAATTVLTIVFNWIVSAWGSLSMPWKLTVFGSVVFFLFLLSLSLLALSVTMPALYALMMSMNLGIGLLNQYSLKHIGAWEQYSAANLARIRMVNGLYFFWTLLTLGAAAQMHWLPSTISEIIWGVVSLVSVCVALYLQHLGLEAERRDLGIP